VFKSFAFMEVQGGKHNLPSLPPNLSEFNSIHTLTGYESNSIFEASFS